MGKPVVGEVVVLPFPQTNLQVGLENMVHNFALMSPFGSHGPLMVKCVKVGAAAEETTANARANREFLDKVVASI